MTLDFRPCTESDRPALHRMRDQAEDWLTKRGFGVQAAAPWSDRAHAAIDRLLDEGRFVGLHDHEPVVAAALAGPDMDFWTDDDDDLHSAWYIARMMTNRHGQGHGRQLVQLIAAAAAADGRRFVRLDCMRDNTGLHTYYRRLGFKLVRIVDHPHRRSGALFQLPVSGLLPAPWDRGGWVRACSPDSPSFEG